MRLGKIYWTYAVRRSSVSNYEPYRLWIEPTSKCNLKCIMCPNKSLEPHQIGMMEFELFKKIIDEAKHYVHDVNLHHRGESLLHKKLTEMIRYASKNGVISKLHTNATLLTEKKATNIIESGLDLISFSFDGFDQQTYERYRVGANFEKTINNILRFLKIKSNLKKKKPFTVLEVIDFSKNDKNYEFGDLYSLKKKFNDLKLNRFVVKKPHNFGGNFKLQDVKKNDFSLI